MCEKWWISTLESTIGAYDRNDTYFSIPVYSKMSLFCNKNVAERKIFLYECANIRDDGIYFLYSCTPEDL